MGQAFITRRGGNGVSSNLTKVIDLSPDTGLPGISIPRSYFEADGNYFIVLNYKTSHPVGDITYTNITLLMSLNMGANELKVFDGSTRLILGEMVSTPDNGGLSVITTDSDYIKVKLDVTASSELFSGFLSALMSSSYDEGFIYHVSYVE